MDFLTKEFVLKIDGVVIMVAMATFTVFIAVLIFYIRSLQNRLKSFDTPKFGFLGKTIYPIFAMLLLGGGVIFVALGIQPPETVDIQADVELDGRITTTTGEETLGRTAVTFEFIPIVSGREWGETGDTFDIYWNITGVETHEQFEFIRSRTSPSNFVKQMVAGSYEIKATVVYNGESFVFTDNLSL